MRGLIGLTFLPLLASATPTLISQISSDNVASSSFSTAKIPDSYIVVFKEHVDDASAMDHHNWVNQIHTQGEAERTELRKRSQSPMMTKAFKGIKHTYNIGGNFLGYAGHFDESVIEKVRSHPDVEYVEEDSMVQTMSIIEKSAPWGLARISHRQRLTFSTFNKYEFAAETGHGVDTYVIDTGINTNHDDFEGRAVWGITIPEYDDDEDDVDVDGNGHGTHCSGTIAGKKYGVAKSANLIAVKVLRSNGSGSMSDVVKGVEWTVNSHLEKVKSKKKGFKGSVANMSLGGGKSPALDRAVNGAVKAGVHFAVAAGNDNRDACHFSPASAELAVTVGASTIGDERAYFSNFGSCTDIFAPGLNILSTWIGSSDATKIISGTSMASPHIAGLLAYYLSLQPDSDSDFATSDLTPQKLKEQLIAIGTRDFLNDMPPNTPNILAWNGGGSSDYSSIIEKGTKSETSELK